MLPVAIHCRCGSDADGAGDGMVLMPVAMVGAVMTVVAKVLVVVVVVMVEVTGWCW